MSVKAEKFLVVLAVICAVYLFGIPGLLHFTPVESAQWESVSGIPEILRHWYWRTHGLGRITWCDADGTWHSVIMRDTGLHGDHEGG